ncbi:hypothetical protein [Fontibacillus sp. BL9]|uniref:hypothetical protein n=1 Tax=Fontibacillus sp. BL9 TaxID=3389971 RepID=UPI00397BEDE1
MISYERVSSFKRFFFGLFGVFLFLGILFFFTSGFHEVLFHNYTNDIRGAILTVVFFVCSLIFLLAALTLRAISYDTVEELNSVQLELKTIKRNLESLSNSNEK